jgi:hypothetical protein
MAISAKKFLERCEAERLSGEPSKVKRGITCAGCLEPIVGVERLDAHPIYSKTDEGDDANDDPIRAPDRPHHT